MTKEEKLAAIKKINALKEERNKLPVGSKKRATLIMEIHELSTELEKHVGGNLTKSLPKMENGGMAGEKEHQEALGDLLLSAPDKSEGGKKFIQKTLGPDMYYRRGSKWFYNTPELKKKTTGELKELANRLKNDYKAEGGNVKFVTDADKYNTTWGRMGQRDGHDAVGSFDIKSNGKTWDGYLYNLDDFDKKYYSHLSLKDGEKLYRYRSSATDVAGYFTVIKVNIKKGLVYFLVDSSAADDKNLVFETKGIKPVYMSLSETEKYAEGGEVKNKRDSYFKSDKLPSATRQREMWVRGKEKEAFELFKNGGGDWSFESYKGIMDAALKNYKPTTKAEYEKLLKDYDYIGAMIDDMDTEQEKELYRHRLKTIGNKIHVYERSDEYAEGGGIKGENKSLLDVTGVRDDKRVTINKKGLTQDEAREMTVDAIKSGLYYDVRTSPSMYAEGGAVEDNGIKLFDAEEKYAEGGDLHGYEFKEDNGEYSLFLSGGFQGINITKTKQGKYRITDSFNNFKDELKNTLSEAKERAMELILNEDEYAEGGNVWSADQKTKVKALDADFEKAVETAGIKRNSKDAADLWRSGGFQKRMGEIFGKKHAEGGPIGSYTSEDKKFNDYKSELKKKYGNDFKNSELSEADFDKLYDLKERKNKAYVSTYPVSDERKMAEGGGVNASDTEDFKKMDELKAKIAKAKANTVMPEALKKQYIAKYEKELNELAFGKDFMDSKDKGAAKEYKTNDKIDPNAVHVADTKKEIEAAIKDGKVKELYDEWEDDNNHSANVLLMAMVIKDKKAIKEAEEIFASHLKTGHASFIMKQRDDLTNRIADKYDAIVHGKKPAPKPTSKKEEKATPATEKKSEYNCDEIIAKEKERREKAKKRSAGPQKSEVTKNIEKIEKVEDNIYKRLEKGEVKKAEIEKLIKETSDLLAALKKALNKL